MGNLQLEYAEEELMMTDPVAEPLIAGGVRCHGGFADDGSYVSPRTKFRMPAIKAWQEQHAEVFGKPLLHAPLETWPENYPNVAQAKFLLRHGVREPIVTTLTRIGTVEGFGSMIRYSIVPNLQRFFDDDITGTSLAHLDRGLFEAHGRDEAGFEDEGGHKQMWFAARDVAFENPATEEEIHEMLARLGLPVTDGVPDFVAMRKQMEAMRQCPTLDFDFEMMMQRMMTVMFVEVQAFHVFAWASEVLGDTDLVAGDDAALKLVDAIRADETPHVEYLRTGLTEIRDRTIIDDSGKKVPGGEVISKLWDFGLSQSLGVRLDQNREMTLREIERAVEGRSDRDELMEEFHSLGSIRPGADGKFAAAALVSTY